ncbi:hypothetical protein [Amycolatopsis sp. NPDC057786]|uniref:phosphorylase family protein n=1 Tax=Amycolatopsis sp. NPDC057786 TaxID=3346250 RepID=UPI00366DB70B
MSANYDTALGTVVICTALDMEYLAVREHLTGPLDEREERGTLYEIGAFSTDRGRWTIALTQTGAGGLPAGVQVERAIALFHPQIVLFVGVAGGRKDVARGDVVIADHIYDYESGKDTATDYLPRIKTAAPSYRLVERARKVARDGAWHHRIQAITPETAPKAVVKPIAAGGKVVADQDAATERFLQQHCGDAAALEMEGHGFLHGAYVNSAVEALVVRGISDLLSGKTGTADKQWQPAASRHAAAFAFELLARHSAAVPPGSDPGQAKEAYEAARKLEMSLDSTVEDLVEIEQLYRKAAVAGHAGAMARVGLIVEGRLRARLRGKVPGEPSAADVETAMHWYAKSAERGSAFGALYLGRLYEERLAKPAEALKWYEKAAADGNEIARSRLDGLQRRLALGLGALAGRAPFDPDLSERKPMPTNTDHERWINQEWGGSEHRAIAFCLGDLAEACGGTHGEWGTLPENEGVAVLGHFSILMPTRIHLPAVACEYYDHIGEGNLRTFAAELLANRHSADRAKEFAPVWWRQRTENRVSTEEFVYTVELALQDYDSLAALLDSLIENTRAEPAPDAEHREILLGLRMISRRLAGPRERAVPAASGDGKWDFTLVLTPEYMRILVGHAAAYSLGQAEQEAPAGFREFWQRVHDALEAANVTPFR